MLLFAAFVACGNIPDVTAPEYTIEELQVATPAGTYHTMVFVPAGNFFMGSDNGPINERPIHDVELEAFYIDKFEVTNGQYLAYVEASGAFVPQYAYEANYNQPGQPVVGVSWADARNYCEWAGLQLPSEAQWEKAAGGVDDRIYPWGNDLPLKMHGNFNFSDGPTAVGSFPDGASPYGALDMAGNVWEWTLDEYDSGYYVNSPIYNPVNLRNAEFNDGPDRSLRGGGWFSSFQEVRVTTRSSLLLLEEKYGERDLDSTLLYARIGFRCAKNATNL